MNSINEFAFRFTSFQISAPSVFFPQAPSGAVAGSNLLSLLLELTHQVSQGWLSLLQSQRPPALAPTGLADNFGFPQIQGYEPPLGGGGQSPAPRGYAWRLAPDTGARELVVSDKPDIIMRQNDQGNWIPHLRESKYPPVPDNTAETWDPAGNVANIVPPAGYHYGVTAYNNSGNAIQHLVPNGMTDVYMERTPQGWLPVQDHELPNA